MSSTNQAKIHGSPGEGARNAGLLRTVGPLLAVAFAGVYALGALVRAPSRPVAAALLVGMAVGLLAGVRFWRVRVGAFFKGAEGEETVGRALAALPAGWHVFHGLNAGGGVGMWRRGDIDHAVAGPGGVFAIETKNWSGRIEAADERIVLDGAAPRRSPTAQARAAADALRATLARGGMRGIEPVPVLCFAGDGWDRGPASVDGVVVCRVEALAAALAAAARGRPETTVDVPRAAAILERARAA